MRHNRTLLAVGQLAHQKIINSHICVLGANPLGAEVIKTFLLFGVNQISIFDNSSVILEDLEANMFITKDSIGENRCEAVKSEIQRLNPNARINILSERPNNESIKKFTLLVVTLQLNFEEICQINELCRQNNVGFAISDVFSFSGFVFIDFGDEFIIENANGRPPEQYRIQAISNANPGIIRFVGKEMPKLPKDSLIRFKDLTSMSELNDFDSINLHYEDGIASLDVDTTNFSKFDRIHPTGFAVQVKKKITLKFLPFKEALDSPFNSIYFTDNHKIVREMFLKRQKGHIDQQNIANQRKQFYLASTTSLIAALVSNECIKYITKNYIPMEKQWFLYNNDDLFDPKTGQTQYEVLEKLKKMNIAIVGVGATGCEAAKLFALHKVNSLTLIDSDSIETTNLNRQVLFSDDDIGKNKAEAAANTIHRFNESIQIHVHQEFVNDETRSTFNDKWFKQFDAIWSMVDSFTGRSYIEKRCAPLGIPSFTGGISKISADWQTLVPNYTPRYTLNEESNDNGTPSCTLKLFPHRPEHCIEWAHHQLNRILQKNDLTDFQSCIDFACKFFIAKFDHKIRDLQFFHPREETNNGALYWSNHRIYPTVIEFDEQNENCKKLINSIVYLLAESNNITKKELDFNQIITYLKQSKWIPPDDSNKSSFEDTENMPHTTLEDLFLHDNEIHIDFIEAASNLRSQNYGLGEIDRLYSQSYAGKIDTAVSTTASICSSSLFIEFLVSIIAPDNLCRGKYLTSPFSYMTFREPMMNKTRFGLSQSEFTPWDYLHYDGTNKTFGEIQKDIEAKANAKLFMWTDENGKLLPVIGKKSFIPLLSSESKFSDFYDAELDSVIIEASLEIHDKIQPEIPPIFISLK
ncbi:ThiF family protein [Tritrichomonas foetus]|uniref:NEDD8-activating enzyme E1 catalytic subunit n=1 Tax=Tritrichomonas foetus TaxID=1144522 RepID=A0A1J4JCZ0_9EUKA|nr:ThiF family protein [Tritrichomonas foetus]|eukprot:OHS95277.1 ThiF family protein [Tritrichomonas foetus]